MDALAWLVILLAVVALGYSIPMLNRFSDRVYDFKPFTIKNLLLVLTVYIGLIGSMLYSDDQPATESMNNYSSTAHDRYPADVRDGRISQSMSANYFSGRESSANSAGRTYSPNTNQIVMRMFAALTGAAVLLYLSLKTNFLIGTYAFGLMLITNLIALMFIIAAVVFYSGHREKKKREAQQSR